MHMSAIAAIHDAANTFVIIPNRSEEAGWASYRGGPRRLTAGGRRLPQATPAGNDRDASRDADYCDAISASASRHILAHSGILFNAGRVMRRSRNCSSRECASSTRPSR